MTDEEMIDRYLRLYGTEYPDCENSARATLLSIVEAARMRGMVELVRELTAERDRNAAAVAADTATALAHLDALEGAVAESLRPPKPVDDP
jgi:hypothetical protein